MLVTLRTQANAARNLLSVFIVVRNADEMLGLGVSVIEAMRHNPK